MIANRVTPGDAEHLASRTDGALDAESVEIGRRVVVEEGALAQALARLRVS